MVAFDRRVSRGGREGMWAEGLEVLQVNLGRACNQSCAHCHLEASPSRTESMGWEVMRQVLRAASLAGPALVDLTGGAPELNPRFREFLGALRADGHPVQVRTNLTVLTEPAQGDLPELFRRLGVRLVGSLPCYLEENVRAQRGPGAYERSVQALLRLNEAGYGIDPALPLDLAYNPGGDSLPGRQADLQEAYRTELDRRFGIRFHRLLAIANLPIGRFASALAAEGRLERYMALLSDAFNPCAVGSVMCRRQLSVDWDGRLYDCDFNLALGLAVDHGAPDRVERFEVQALASRRIVTGPHCYGCTAGAGSGCGGALVER